MVRWIARHCKEKWLKTVDKNGDEKNLKLTLNSIKKKKKKHVVSLEFNEINRNKVKYFLRKESYENSMQQNNFSQS